MSTTVGNVHRRERASMCVVSTNANVFNAF